VTSITNCLAGSTDNAKLGTFYESSAPVVGGDFTEEGRYVAFVSSAVGLGGSLGKKRQIFWRDRNTGETKLISIGLKGAEGNGDSFAPSISADGQSVAFESYATNLVPIDTNDVRDIFVWNARTNTVTAVSTGAGEIETNSESFDPVISGDGSLIAFSSSASNLAPGVSGINTVNVYLKRVGSGQAPVLISADPKTKKGVGGSNPSISDDGSKVAFYSFASTLVADDKNDLWDIFLYNSNNPKLKRLSIPVSAGERDQGTESASRVIAPSISGNGNFVAFATTATNMVAGDTNKLQDVFVVNVETGEVKRVSNGTGGEQGNADSPITQGEKVAISFDGSWVAFSTSATNLGGEIILKNVLTGEIRVIAKEQRFGVGRPAISRNGGYVVFGAGSRLDSRFQSTGIFAGFTGITRCRFCNR
jgi:Tol biopolymer transport system component